MKKILEFNFIRVLGIVTLVSVLLAHIPWALADDFPAYWAANGPYGGEIKDIVLSPDYKTDNTIFAATNGGVYKSADGGDSWTKLIPYHSYSLSALAISPGYSNDQTVFAGGPNHLLKSNDGGDTWKNTDSPIKSSSLIISPNYINDQTVLIGSQWQEGIAKSSDGGQSWTMINTGLTDLSVVSLAFSLDFVNDHTVFAGTDYAVFKSTNGGDSWDNIATFGKYYYAKALAVSPDYSVDQTIFVGLINNSMYISTDAGENWTDTGVSAVVSLAISPNFASDKAIFAGTWHSEVFKSTNGGTDWKLVKNGLPVNWIKSLCISPDFATDQTIYAGLGVNGNGPGLFKSTNEGDQWYKVEGLDIPRGITSLDISPLYAFDKTIFVGSGSDVFKSTDSNLSWLMVGSGIGGKIALSPCYVLDRTVFAVSYYDCFYKSINGGKSWEKIITDMPSSNVWDLALSPNYFFDRTLFVGGNRGVYRSRDGGRTWTEVNAGLTDNAIEIEISPNYPKDHTIFAAGNNYGVFKSVNRGELWENVSNGLPQSTGYNGPSIEALSISPNYANDETIFASVAYEDIFRSTDGGTSWDSVYPDYAFSFALSPNYANDGTIFASIRYNYLIISQDYGNTWMKINTTDLSKSTTLSLIDVSPHFSYDHILFCGTNEGVFQVNILIHLLSFKVIPKSNKNIIKWTTESEVENDGFDIYRAESKNGSYIKVNDSLIPAKGSPNKGAAYELVDDDVKNRKKYYYKLKAISLNGIETEYGPVGATPRLIFWFPS